MIIFVGIINPTLFLLFFLFYLCFLVFISSSTCCLSAAYLQKLFLLSLFVILCLIFLGHEDGRAETSFGCPFSILLAYFSTFNLKVSLFTETSSVLYPLLQDYRFAQNTQQINYSTMHIFEICVIN